jgi:hypothetical protein
VFSVRIIGFQRDMRQVVKKKLKMLYLSNGGFNRKITFTIFPVVPY